MWVCDSTKLKTWFQCRRCLMLLLLCCCCLGVGWIIYVPDYFSRACMQIEKFFGRFSLRAGCMTVAALYTMISVVAILTVHNIGGANVLPKDKLFPLQICTTFVSIVVITFSGLYVLGIKKVSPELMHPCVLLDVIVGFILSFALPFAVVKFYKFDSKVKAACTTVVGLLYLALHAYLWLVILTFYREIKAEAEIADEPNEAEG